MRAEARPSRRSGPSLGLSQAVSSASWLRAPRRGGGWWRHLRWWLSVAKNTPREHGGLLDPDPEGRSVMVRGVEKLDAAPAAISFHLRLLVDFAGDTGAIAESAATIRLPIHITTLNKRSRKVA